MSEKIGKCGECKWFQEDTRSPQEVAQLLSQVSGLSVDALGEFRVDRITTKSGICLAPIQEEQKVVFSRFSCTVRDDKGNHQFTPKNIQ